MILEAEGLNSNELALGKSPWLCHIMADGIVEGASMTEIIWRDRR
jgi:hypothetical protein